MHVNRPAEKVDEDNDQDWKRLAGQLGAQVDSFGCHISNTEERVGAVQEDRETA